MSDFEKLKADALREFIALGTDLRRDLWTDQDKAFLGLMAADLSGLAAKLARETNPDKRARIQRSLDLISNHVAVMTFSRLNVAEQRVQEVVLAVLQKAAKLTVRALLAAVGLS